jgi:hypothetical protein
MERPSPAEVSRALKALGLGFALGAVMALFSRRRG